LHTDREGKIGKGCAATERQPAMSIEQVELKLLVAQLLVNKEILRLNGLGVIVNVDFKIRERWIGQGNQSRHRASSKRYSNGSRNSDGYGSALYDHSVLT